ncbi:hypothetical protein Tsubulata_007930 [Turnera subulata]|uniref:MBD domain-containing protein n=1 Tax=Turnera subulata TaxID=218843 RepID=A0A9Q0FN49_9ROSI|nr:hypothetical protein Tsubulata_007930 [Turnera subulata]
MAKKSSSLKPSQFHNKKLPAVGPLLPSSPSPSPSSSSEPFKLPCDWKVLKRPRGKHPFTVDKYYIEPGTGKKFRSLISVQRYLTGETDATPRPVRVKTGNQNNLQVVPCSVLNSGSRFHLPPDWIVEEIPRKSINYAGKIDRYYIEPGSGRRFRSLLSAEKYLAEGNEHKSAPSPQALNPAAQLTMQIVPFVSKNRSKRNLPVGWVVEEKPRKNVNYVGQIDRYYIEPETGKRFRSLLAVERYLTEGTRHAPTPTTLQALKLEDHFTPSENCGPQRRYLCDEYIENSMLEFSSPPAKSGRFFGGFRDDVWSPHLDDPMAPECFDQKCFETFLSTLDDRS